MADPGERNPLTPAEVRAKSRDAVTRALRNIDELNDRPNAEQILKQAFHEGATAVEMLEAISEAAQGRPRR